MKDLDKKRGITQAVPFFMVADMLRSLSFYLDGIGFELRNKWEPRGRIEWCWLQFDQVALMLQEYRITTFPENRGEGVSICFMCEDALALYHQFIDRGLSPAEPFVGNGLWVVGLTDPDGYRLIFESPTHLPEETRYADWSQLNSTKSS
ncbi:VOC family protein [Larkinella sp. VNQ87]|uniref:VOC family protein n=1 Tax=Larkinella sp. VNQ87 TaxID=3400921 RepID=UPI003C054439